MNLIELDGKIYLAIILSANNSKFRKGYHLLSKSRENTKNYTEYNKNNRIQFYNQ